MSLTTRLLIAHRLCRPAAGIGAQSTTQQTVCNVLFRRSFASRPSRFTNVKKSQPKVEVLEREKPSVHEQFYQQSQARTGAPSVVPGYTDDRQQQQQQQSLRDSMDAGAMQYVGKVYTTLAGGVGVAAGTSMVSMASGFMLPPLVGLVGLVPLLGLYMIDPAKLSPGLRAGMFASFCGISGLSLAPMLKLYMMMSPLIVPGALAATAGIFGSMSLLAFMAPAGSTARWGAPLGGGMLVLFGMGIASFFVGPTSPWYPVLHNIWLYGGLALFSVYVAYDTQMMLSDYEQGDRDHLKHAAGLFINTKAIFVRMLVILGVMSDD